MNIITLKTIAETLIKNHFNSENIKKHPSTVGYIENMSKEKGEYFFVDGSKIIKDQNKYNIIKSIAM